MKIAAGIEYRGTCFSGWQRQKHAASIQQHVEEALSMVANHDVTTTCAGRTDAGVHAILQVIHFETTALRKSHSWVLGANANMTADICLLWARQVKEDFHARFSATGRCYRYVILNRKHRPGICHGLVTWEHRPLDIDLMSTAAAHLVGMHDYTSYRAMACQARNPVREVRRIDIYRKDQYVIIEIEANAFLHHMVRNIAGVLMTIGKQDEAPGWAKEILQARDRNQGGITAPADGLYLLNVEYPHVYGVPVGGSTTGMGLW
jgi:tRNA pseudouridine38-40 synthase